ncbi:MAG: hypothetical protein K9I85_13935 [Saprospiraceae bacterium]|nr:hypothetical protein [Saprospiraceae bacterium]
MILFLLIGCTSVSPTEELSIPDEWVSQDQSGWVESQGILFLEGTPFSGWKYAIEEQNDTLYLGGFVDGLAEWRHVSKYPDGQLSEIRHFKNGRQEGLGQEWYENGQKAFEANFIQDHYEGSVRTWYENGQPHEQFQYQNGKEEGRQQRWDGKGNVLANYEVREGRKYGFSGTKHCTSPWAVDSLDMGGL